jgi:hypothetical protein
MTSFQFAWVLSKNNGITYAKSFGSAYDSAIAGWLRFGCRFPVGAKERGKQPATATKPDNTQTGVIELRDLDLVFFAPFAF